MVVKDVLAEGAYPVEVAYNGGEEFFNVTINDTSIFVTRDEWDQLSKFINDSMDFMTRSVEY